jgi:hypothetical protein
MKHRAWLANGQREYKNDRAYSEIDFSWKEHYHACIQRDDVGVFCWYVIGGVPEGYQERLLMC